MKRTADPKTIELSLVPSSAPRSRYLLQTVQAPPLVKANTATVVQQIEAPDGYELQNWRAFGTAGDDAWGYALMLWERTEAQWWEGRTLHLETPRDADRYVALPLDVRVSPERNERMGLDGRDGFRVHYPGGMSVWLPDDVFWASFRRAEDT